MIGQQKGGMVVGPSSPTGGHRLKDTATAAIADVNFGNVIFAVLNSAKVLYVAYYIGRTTR